MTRLSLLPILLALLLAGCQAPSGPGGMRGPVPPPPSGPEVDDRIDTTRPPAPVQNPAVTTLLAAAGEQAAAGDTLSARGTIERALRIEPRNARLWNRLARLYYQDRQYLKAANTAAKSNSLAGADRALKHENWNLIARARRKAGDESGARMAEEKAAAIR